MSKTYRNIIRVLGVVFLVGVILPIFGGTASASFDKNRIISDSVMDNKNVMSAAQIDAFLNTHDDSCISTDSGFQAIKPTGYSPGGGFEYGSFTSAGGVIYAAAQAY